MTETNVFQLAQPGSFSDSLTDVLCEGVRALLAQAVEAEVAEFLARHADRTTVDGRRRIVLSALVRKDAPGLSASTIASRRRGARSTTAGASAICPPSGTSIGGSMASIWKRALRIRRNASS